MRRRQPLSTLFPYTTLFRSLSHSRVGNHSFELTPPWRTPPRRSLLRLVAVMAIANALQRRLIAGIRQTSQRSEEHTSELQSQFHLVCRLLLEKKKYTSRHRP